MTEAGDCHREMLPLKLEKGPRHQGTMNQIFKRWQSMSIRQEKAHFWNLNRSDLDKATALLSTFSHPHEDWVLTVSCMVFWALCKYLQVSAHFRLTTAPSLSCHGKVTAVWDSNLGWLQSLLTFLLPCVVFLLWNSCSFKALSIRNCSSLAVDSQSLTLCYLELSTEHLVGSFFLGSRAWWAFHEFRLALTSDF